MRYDNILQFHVPSHRAVVRQAPPRSVGHTEETAVWFVHLTSGPQRPDTAVVTDKKVNIDRFYQTWGYHPFYHPNVLSPRFSHWPNNSSTIVREYKVGTLVLDIVDPVNKQVIWRGSVTKPLGIYRNRSPEERATIALSNAEFMLASFPPQKVISE